MKYKAFISYSHSCRQLASALEVALQRFGNPWHELTSIPVFRDTTNLSATPELWPKIQEALNDSEYFLLLASEESARSKWVTKEIQYWRDFRDVSRLLLLLADGQIKWDDQAGDFDFEKTTALPEVISKTFFMEPLYADFREIKPEHYDLSHPGFCDRIATVAAPLRGKSKDELFGIQVSAQVIAEAQRLIAEAELSLFNGFPERSLLLSCAALRLTQDRGEPRLPRAKAILRSGLNQFGGWPLGPVGSNINALPFVFSPDNHRLHMTGEDGKTRMLDLDDVTADTACSILETDETLPELAKEPSNTSPDGRWLMHYDDTSYLVDLQSDDPSQAYPLPSYGGMIWKHAFSPDSL